MLFLLTVLALVLITSFTASRIVHVIMISPCYNTIIISKGNRKFVIVTFAMDRSIINSNMFCREILCMA